MKRRIIHTAVAVATVLVCANGAAQAADLLYNDGGTHNLAYLTHDGKVGIYNTTTVDITDFLTTTGSGYIDMNNTSDLDVGGLTTISKNANVYGGSTFDATGAATIGAALNVSGTDSRLNALAGLVVQDEVKAESGGVVDVTGDLTVNRTNNTNIYMNNGGRINVSGNATLHHRSEIRGGSTFDVTGDLTTSGDGKLEFYDASALSCLKIRIKGL